MPHPSSKEIHGMLTVLLQIPELPGNFTLDLQTIFIQLFAQIPMNGGKKH